MNATVTNRTEESIGFNVNTKSDGSSETLFDLADYSLSVIVSKDLGMVEIVIDKEEKK